MLAQRVNRPLAASRAPGVAVTTAVMAYSGSSSSEDDTRQQRSTFKGGKRFLNSSGSDEGGMGIRRGKQSRFKISDKKKGLECGRGASDEDREESSSEDEMPTRGRFKKTPSKKNHGSESSEGEESLNEGHRKGKRPIRRTREQAEAKKKKGELRKEQARPVTRSQTKLFKDDSAESSSEEDGAEESEDESDGNVKMSRKSNACVISSSSDEDDDGSGSGIESETKLFEVETSVKTSRYPGRCSHPKCDERFIKGRTNIIGVLLWNGVSFEGKENGKPFWICAKHSSFTKPKEIEHHLIDQDEEEEEPNSEDEDFIDDEEADEDQSEGSSSTAEAENDEYKEIIQSLKRRTPNDKINTSKYLEEQSKPQLEIHTETNPSLYLSPQKRLKRNLRTAAFDKGLKQERGIEWQDPEYGLSQDVTIDNRTKIRIFPRKIMQSRWSQFCSLGSCDKKFYKGSKIIGAMLPREGRLQLNDRGKLFFICYNHVYTDDLL